GVDRLNRSTKALFEAAQRGFDNTHHASAAAKEDTREALARQTILVIHRGLMHEIRNRGFVSFGTIPEEDHMLAAHDHNRCVLRAQMNNQPVARWNVRATEEEIHHAERREVNEPRIDLQLVADGFVLRDHIAPRRDDEKLRTSI